MADVEISYKGSTIATTSATGTKTLLTQGKYCEDDIEISYTKPPASYIILKSFEGALLTCGTQSYQLQSGETEHSFLIDLGTYTVTATLNQNVKSDTVLVDITGIYNVELYPSRLPNTYQEVEYLESTGTQFIDSLYNLSNENSFELDYELSERQYGIGIFGTYINDSCRYECVTRRSNQTSAGNLEYGFYNSLNYTLAQDTNRHVVKQDKNLLYVDGSLKFNLTNGIFTQNLSAYIGNVHVSGSTVTPMSGKIYSCNIYSNYTTLQREFKPCYRKLDNKPGLYDLVNNVFYTNAGTGEYIVGGNV